jgi:hypothetical protein
MCIHFQSVYQNGIENYMQVMRLALDDVWQMHSIWALSGVVWAISSGVLVWHWRMVRLELVNEGKWLINDLGVGSRCAFGGVARPGDPCCIRINVSVTFRRQRRH